MNKISFVDELVKLGALRCLYKQGNPTSSANTIDVPVGMMAQGPLPEYIPVRPDQAATRLPVTAGLPSVMDNSVGLLGEVATAKDPIDREKYNRVYMDRR